MAGVRPKATGYKAKTKDLGSIPRPSPKSKNSGLKAKAEA